MADIEYFYSAHSAFAYLGSMRLMEIADTAGRQLVHKPMNLNAVVAAANPENFRDRSRAHSNYYFGREIERWAEYRQVGFKGGIPENHRNNITLANTVLIAAAGQGLNIDKLAHIMMEAHWRDHADLADKSTLASLISSAGVDPQIVFKLAGTPDVIAIYQKNTADAIERSMFGSPTYVVDGDMFYGQDHLELVERALHRPFENSWPKM